MNVLDGRHAASTAPGWGLNPVNHLDHGYDLKTAVHEKKSGSRNQPLSRALGAANLAGLLVIARGKSSYACLRPHPLRWIALLVDLRTPGTIEKRDQPDCHEARRNRKDCR